MRNIFHEFLNPHCSHCKLEREESKICASCETLKFELERLRAENKEILRLALYPKETTVVENLPPKISIPRQIPWHIKRQMLEAEDKERAKLMRQASQPNTDVDKLEAELGIAEQERENGTATRTPR